MPGIDSLLIIGHRGAAGLVPENTLPSFQRAVELGVDAIELDVHFLEGRLWVIHDTELDRTTNGSGPLKAQTTAQLRALDAGNGARIPFLEEVMELIPPSLLLNIELKGAGTAAPVAQFLRAHSHSEFLVSSFNHEELRGFAKLAPDVPVAPLFDRWRGDPAATGREFGAQYVNLSARITTKERCAAISAAGMQVLTYTVNDVSLARKLAGYGVAGIFTDFPDRFRTAAPAR
jgi:glycerophosphoryl diester phosphodiesterase